MNKEHLELYTDYLLNTFGYATATGLSHEEDCQAKRFTPIEELTWLKGRCL